MKFRDGDKNEDKKKSQNETHETTAILYSCYTDLMAPLAAMLTFLKMEVVSQLVPG